MDPIKATVEHMITGNWAGGHRQTRIVYEARCGAASKEADGIYLVDALEVAKDGEQLLAGFVGF